MLKAANLTESQSRAIVNIMQETVNHKVFDLLKTSEFQLSFQELKLDIQSTSSDLEMPLIKYIFAHGIMVTSSMVPRLHVLR